MLISYRSDNNMLKYVLWGSMLVLLGYILVFIETAAARLLHLTAISLFDLLLIATVVIAWSALFIIVVLAKKTYGPTFEKYLFIWHLIAYLAMYGVWVYLLYDFRIFALFSSLLAITIVLTYTNIIQSLIMSVSTVIVYLIAAYLSVYSEGHTGNFTYDVFFAACFLPSAVILSIIANHIHKKNKELNESKNYLEDANNRLVSLNKELEHNHKMAKIELELAYDIQKTLLPAEPVSNADWDIALSYRPRYGVSGDFYDFYYENNILSGLSLFDVSGHGIASGLITILAKPVFSRYFNKFRNDPLERVIEIADYTLRKELNQISMYITGIMIRLTGEYFEYINAGHPDILYKSNSTKNVENISNIVPGNKFPPIGLIDAVSAYKSAKVTPEKGDSILMYTDCITETNNHDKCRYGTERLIESYKQAPDGTAKELMDFIVNRFYNFLDEKDIDDDFTLIVVKKL
ncbi:MAG: SpoIIE family protein phosphatase [Spirochaetes bacterium]|nr:SpoIIE family protein phosphatase [Spirochaetota bacterium]